jgi:hypothetical protein
MTVLVAIISCHQHRQRRDWQRQTWLPDLKFDYKFFVGQPQSGGPEPEDNVVVFNNVKDDYNSLPDKTYAMVKWAYEHKYTHIFKIDDDVYCRPERLEIPKEDYVGHAYGHRYYCSGAAYWLSNKSIEAIIDKWYKRTNAEDSCVGETLKFHGIHLTEDPRYKVGWKSFPKDEGENEFPHPSNDFVTFHLYFPNLMLEMHKNWRTHKQWIIPPKGDLKAVSCS